MKIFLRSILLTTLAAISFYALADTDFVRIKKDVTVMSQILKGAFDSSKKVRGVRIDANYLASQGAIFTVNAPPSISSYAFRVDGSDDSAVYVYNDDDGVAPMAPVAPVRPINMSDVSENVQFALESLDDFEWVSEFADLPNMHFEFSNGVDRETRAAMRELARSMREVEREISENRIQMIHVDDDADRKDLEKQIAELEKQRAEQEGKLAKLEENLEAERDKIESKRAEIREKAMAARKEQMEELESTVMQSLCDYGSTLKNLPEKEHISVVMKPIVRDGQQQIYVFNKEDVTACKTDGKRLKQQAMAYVF